MMVLERYGFWVACALTVLGIALLYVNADWVPQQDRAPRPVVAEEAGGFTPDQREAAQARSGSALEPDASAVQGVPISIITDPAGATIFVDDTYVGVPTIIGAGGHSGRFWITSWPLSRTTPNWARLP